MPKYEIKCTATATITELWRVTAADEDTAREAFDVGKSGVMEFIEQIKVDDEHDREIIEVINITPDEPVLTPMLIFAAHDSEGQPAAYAVMTEAKWTEWVDGDILPDVPDMFGLFYCDDTPCDVFDDWQGAMQHVTEADGKLVDVFACIAY